MFFLVIFRNISKKRNGILYYYHGFKVNSCFTETAEFIVQRTMHALLLCWLAL